MFSVWAMKKRLDLRLEMTILVSVMRSVFEQVAISTDSGTILPGQTMAVIRDSLVSYLYQERTGVIMPAQLQKMPWHKIFIHAKVDPNQPDITKVTSFLEKELGEWLTDNAGKVRNIPSVQLDPEFAKNGAKTLHAIFKSGGNQQKLDRLAFRYGIAVGQDSDEQVDHIRTQIRLFASQHATVLHITRGAEATVTRLQDEKGKATGEVIAEGGTASSGKTFSRYSLQMQKLFESKHDFEMAKSHYKKDAISMQEAEAFAAGTHHN